MRVVSVLGMGLTFSAGVLLLIAAEWVWGLLALAGILPFLGMMYGVDRIMMQAARPSGGRPRDVGP